MIWTGGVGGIAASLLRHPHFLKYPSILMLSSNYIALYPPEFGPDVEWVEAVDYSLDPSRSRSFYEAIRGYYPGLEDGTLQP